jgi:hypothetical protein
MFSSRIFAAARTAMAVAFIGLAGVPLVSACHSTTASTSSATTSTAAAGVYGDPAAVAKYWRQQSLEDNCGLMSVADVVGELTGHQPTEQQMITLAQNTSSGTNSGLIYAPSTDPNHENGNGGVEMADLVVLLDHYGIKSAMYWTAHPETTGMPALQQYLRDGRKAIAWVNSAVIWNTSDQPTKADHYLVVTGIDTNKKIIHLNDPGADHADEQVSFTTFTNAWRTGEESIVVTMPAG